MKAPCLSSLAAGLLLTSCVLAELASTRMSDPLKGVWSLRNFIPRLIFRSAYVRTPSLSFALALLPLLHSARQTWLVLGSCTAPHTDRQLAALLGFRVCLFAGGSILPQL